MLGVSAIRQRHGHAVARQIDRLGQRTKPEAYTGRFEALLNRRGRLLRQQRGQTTAQRFHDFNLKPGTNQVISRPVMTAFTRWVTAPKWKAMCCPISCH